MKRNIFLIFAGILFTGGYGLLGQTAGTLTFSCNTTAPTGSWGDKHVLAVWIQNNANPSVFIKTKAKYGSQDDHLTSWSAISGKNTVDAVTGATLQSYGTISVSWNGTDVSNSLVPDGDYTLYIEMGWGKDKVVQHSLGSYSFTKGATSQNLSPVATANYTNTSLVWQPLTSFISPGEKSELFSVYPNPSGGHVNLSFRKDTRQATISLINLAGEVVYEEQIMDQPEGVRVFDFSDLTPGMYILTLHSGNTIESCMLILEKHN